MQKPKVLEFLIKYQDEIQMCIPQEIELDELIDELDAYIANHQGIKRRLDNAVFTIRKINRVNTKGI